MVVRASKRARRSGGSIRRIVVPVSRTTLRYAVNVSILFSEVPFFERFARVRAAGFGAVEVWWPAGDRGLLSDPDRCGRFRDNVPVALEPARDLGCRRLNALVGLELAPGRRTEQLAPAQESVGWAADQAAAVG